MRCFSIENAKPRAGFAIKDVKSETPYVSFSAGTVGEEDKLLLDDALKAKLQDPVRSALFYEEKAVLLACDFEDRGQQWLRPESDEGSDDALVLLTHFVSGDLKDLVAVTLTFSEDCEVLLRHNTLDLFRRQYPNYRIESEAALVRMPKSAWIGIETIVNKSPSRWSFSGSWKLERTVYKIGMGDNRQPIVVSASGEKAVIW